VCLYRNGPGHSNTIWDWADRSDHSTVERAASTDVTYQPLRQLLCAELSFEFLALSPEALATPLPGSSLLPTPAGALATIAAKGQPGKIAQPGLDLYFPPLSQQTPPFFQHSCFPSLLRKHALFLIPGSCFMKQSWAGCLGGTGHKVAVG